MKRLFRILLGMSIVLVLFLMVGMLLPRTQHIERSLMINVGAPTIYPYLVDFRKFNQWSPWVSVDKNVQFEYQGAEQGVGAIMHWRSQHERVGHGSQKILQASLDQGVTTVLAIKGLGKAYSGFTLSALGRGTKVTWSFDVDFGYNIPGRIMGLLMQDDLAEMYDRGLLNLKNLIENQ